MPSHTRSLAVAALLALSVAPTPGCHHRKSGGLTPGEAGEAAEAVVLEVENHNWSDIVIYIVHDGMTDRLLSVTATKDATVPIPRVYQGDMGVFRLVVHRIGGRDAYTSEPISVRTGNTVRLTVESTLARSSVGVW